MTHLFHFFYTEPKPQVDMELEKSQVNSLALGVLSINVFSLLAQIVLLLLLSNSPWYNHPAFEIVVGSTGMYLIAFPLSMLFFRRCRATAPAEKRSLAPLDIFALISIAMTLTLAGSIIGTLITNLLASLQGQAGSNPVADATENTPVWAILVFMVLLGPICEELLFRRVLINRLRRYGELPAILISGLVFGLIHGNFSQLFYATLLGFFFGFIYVKTGKLRYTVFLHVFINFFGGAWTTVIQRLFGGEIPAEFTPEMVAEYLTPILMTFGYYALYLLCLAGLIPSLICLKQLRGKKEPEVSLTKKQTCSLTLASFPFLLSAVVLVGLLVMSIFLT